MKVQKIFGVVVDMDDTIDDKDDDDFGLLNCDLLKIGKPSWFRTLSCHGLGKVGAVFRVFGQLAFGLHVSRMITKLMDDGARSVVILVDGRGLGLGGKVAFGFQVVLQLVDDRSRWAEVAVLASHLRGLFEGSFGFQMVLEGGHNVATRSRQGFVLHLGLGLVGQGVGGQT